MEKELSVPFIAGSVFQESLRDLVSFGIYSDPSLS